MKIIILFTLVCLFQVCNTQKKRAIVGESQFQIEMNTEFKDASKSPLTKKGLRNFKGLSFFKINNKFKVNATLLKAEDVEVFEFPTTTDRVVRYAKYGTIFFTIDNKRFELAIYKDEFPLEEYKNHLFLPFFDKTNGNSSYEGGRFIDVLTTDEQEDGTIIIDFNKAFNPYCAYSNRYSCPITPRSNYLDIAIEAGVKAYKNSMKNHT